MTLSSDAATLYNKVEATLKVQERYFKKTLKQHSAKHYKEIFKRNEALLRSPVQQCSGQARSSVRLVKHARFLSRSDFQHFWKQSGI